MSKKELADKPPQDDKASNRDRILWLLDSKLIVADVLKTWFTDSDVKKKLASLYAEHFPKGAKIQGANIKAVFRHKGWAELVPAKGEGKPRGSKAGKATATDSDDVTVIRNFAELAKAKELLTVLRTQEAEIASQRKRITAGISAFDGLLQSLQESGWTPPEGWGEDNSGIPLTEAEKAEQE